MAHTLKTVTVIGTLLSMLWLSACGSSAPETTPTLATLDLDPFRTEVASTVMAQVSQTLSAAPSATPMPSPTATSAPIAVPSATSTLPAGASPAPEVTAPGASPTPVGTNLAKWISQTIPDGTVFQPGEVFTNTIRMKNVGTSVWTTAYRLRFYTGDPYGAPREIVLGRDVLPGEEVDIPLPMKAPTNPGDYRTDWVLSDANLYNFKEPIFFKFSVAKPATATRAPTATTTATPTPKP